MVNTYVTITGHSALAEVKVGIGIPLLGLGIPCGNH
jgi:hypothetical protein